MNLQIPLKHHFFRTNIIYLLLFAFLFTSTPAFSQANTFKKVKAETVDFSGEKCETFSWKIKFSLEGGCPNGGWIVQKIQSNWKVTDCEETWGNSSFNNFFEAWEVAPGATTATPSAPISPGSSVTYNDNYSYTIQDNTKGEFHVKGDFAFIANPPGGSALDTSKWKKGSVAQAGGLMATRNTPTWWKAMSSSGKTTKHNLDLYWICCGTDQDTTYYDTLIVTPPIVPDTIIVEEPKINDKNKILDPKNHQGLKCDNSNPGPSPSLKSNSEPNPTITKDYSFQVYPIPVSDRLFIQSNTFIDQELQIRLLNINGQVLIDQQRTFSTETSFDVSSFPPGVYFVLIQNLNGDIIERHQIVK